MPHPFWCWWIRRQEINRFSQTQLSGIFGFCHRDMQYEMGLFNSHHDNLIIWYETAEHMTTVTNETDRHVRILVYTMPKSKVLIRFSWNAITLIKWYLKSCIFPALLKEQNGNRLEISVFARHEKMEPNSLWNVDQTKKVETSNRKN